VPFAAAANAVVQHLASETRVGEDADGEVDHDDGHVGDLEDADLADEFDEFDDE